MSLEANKQIVQRYHTELWAGNVAVVDELLGSSFNSAMGTADEIKATVSGALALVPDLKFSIEELIAEGNKVVMRWKISGTNTGPDIAPGGMPLPPTGQPFTYTGITINQIEQGKLVSDVYENSWLNMLMDMGRLAPVQ